MENGKENILTGYCFLAALTENQNDLYNYVFVPICKRALSLYSLKGSTHGAATDIKNLIVEEYGIDIPVIMVKKLINSTFNSLSNKLRENHKFKIIQGGDFFEIDKYTFAELEIQYKKGKRNAQAIQAAFIAYLKSEGLVIQDIPTFADFLSKNKRHLARFFKNSEVINGERLDQTYIHHVHFLEFIETNNHELYNIAEGLYIGSIVASYLEAGLDLEPKFENKEEYYLDTPVILRALDIQKEEECQPILELLDLIRKTGGEIRILSITIDEINSVVENAINGYHATIPTSTINEACVRLKKNKAWLIGFNSKLEENIAASLKAKIIPVLPSFREKNSKSHDVKALQEKRVRKGNALHDVLSYLYVREARGGVVRSFQKARIWVLTNNSNLLTFNREHNPNKGVSEIILTDALTSLLWLKDPSKLFNKVKAIGLSELMANTLNEEIASKELINEFEATLTSLGDLQDEDYRTLLESVAHQSAKMIDNFNHVANQDKGKGTLEAHKIVERERSRKAKQQKIVKETQQKEKDVSTKNTELADQLNKIQSELEGSKNRDGETKTLIEELSGKLNAQTSELLSLKGVQKSNQRLKMIIFSILFVLLSILWWTSDAIFSIAFFKEHSNYIFIKFVGQALLISLSAVILNKSYRGSWITGTIALCIAFCVLSKPDSAPKPLEESNTKDSLSLPKDTVKK